LRSNNGLSAISPVGPGPLLETTLEDWKRGAFRPKSKPGHIRPGALRVAAQYMQKRPKNNVFFGRWLTEFYPGVSGG
jgi:hypothetical protein